jgi:4-hydroxybenzoate polyprenyltransferase
MIINDIFDINIDKINNPTRPLITGKIKLSEAYFLLIFFLAITEFINIYFLPNNLQYIIHIALLYTLIYTPILKKIPLIKNLSCATIVSSSIYVGGLATITNINTNININLLYQSMLLVFLGSLYNEILLDISDYEGDKKNNIFTLATIFGKNTSLFISKKILEFNIFINTLLIYNLGYINYSLLFMLTSLPILYNFYKIKINYYQKDDILNTFKTSSNQMVFMLLIICLISK